ncbi:MAG: PaaI family thioesterase [Acidimicrobiia bacterium]
MGSADEPDLDPGRWDAAASSARRRLVAATRAFADAAVDVDAPDDVLDRIAGDLEHWAADLHPGPDRRARVDDLKMTAYDDGPAATGTTNHNPDCVVCGPGNPISLGMVVERDGADVVARLTLGAARRGAPGRVHGGLLSLAMDDLMGHVLVVEGLPAYTVRLDTEFLAAGPIGEELVLRSGVTGREGRRLSLWATVHAGEVLVARADALFITVERLVAAPSRAAGESPAPDQNSAASTSRPAT